MINKVRVALASVFSKHRAQSCPCTPEREPPDSVTPTPPCRPAFLRLSPEELQASGDHASRIVLSPKRPADLHWETGYAEVVNAGKSLHNEDQACCELVTVERRDGKWIDNCKETQNFEQKVNPEQRNVHQEDDGICFYYWGLFDGHAGCGCALAASRLLHLHICDQLRDLMHILPQPTAAPLILNPDTETELVTGTLIPNNIKSPLESTIRFHLEKQVFPESLVIGAIENAFKEMDEQIKRERTSYRIDGGCCALVAVCLMGKLYVANAGDSRYNIIRLHQQSVHLFLCFQAFLKPELLGNEFTYLEFPRRIQQKELQKRMLYRDHTMTGWAYKTIEEGDMKFPLIYGEGKKARVMATIGVTRGLGDHDLKVFNSNIYIKPFLSCVPEVRVYDLTGFEHSPDDVMVIGTDGLWDVINDKQVADIVQRVLASHDSNLPNRYNLLAQELVLQTRGTLKENSWRLANGALGSGDDISVFVIPLAGHR
ncbi:LOW QUALITY PROTEIN: protein phosphatase 1J [Rhinophrynus dorsalis]